MGTAYSTTKFILFGRKHFNRNGWLSAQKKYANSPATALDLDSVDLKNKVYAVTGANSGIGKALTEYLAKQGAKVYMICRNEERANKAKDEICTSLKQDDAAERLQVLIADVSVIADVKVAAETLNKQESKLDCLVCNAGALMKSKIMTKDNLEVTFASHLAVGTYLLSRLTMPLLEKAEDPRLVVVTSGGMYTTKYPGFRTAGMADHSSFNGQLQYAYAKRGQVLLCEKWAEKYAKLTTVSAHPGWTSTPALDSTYGAFEKKVLSPLRTPWEGAEGIAWLCVSPSTVLENGKLYLDRFVQPFHLVNNTKNSPKEIDELFKSLGESTGLPFDE